ncbi:MAG: peptidoglycan-binding domain-containing protein [Minisyncoccia bacterium]
MKLKFFVFAFVLFSFLILNTNVLASTSNGTIDPTYHYAWGENIGWVDFANITITDTALSGSVYGENIGWIDLSTVTNDNEGNLSGHAWGENVGWVDFASTIIGSDGVFTGGAYGENIGWITFGTGDNKVVTDWRPASTISSGSSSGSRPKTITPITTETVCPVGHKYSTTTGLPCTNFIFVSTPGTTPNTCFLTLTLRLGDRGEQVKCLQNKLNITSDGIFGPITKATVIIFQNANLLVPDGIVGPQTRAKLQ